MVLRKAFSVVVLVAVPDDLNTLWILRRALDRDLNKLWVLRRTLDRLVDVDLE
jgi:hypothetical protein